MRTFTRAPLLVLLVSGSAACVAKSHAGESRPAEPAFKVETQAVAQREVATTITLTGTLNANQRSLVAADGSGRVIATFVDRGSVVRAGDPLLRLDVRGAALSNAEAHAQAAAARATSERARRDCQRAMELLAQEAINQQEYDRMTADCHATAAQADAAAAREGLAGKAISDAIVRAPFAGVVDERMVSVGEYVRAGQAVATVIDIATLRLELTVPESAVSHVREGQTVEFEVAAYPDETFSGTLRWLSGAMRRSSRDLIVEATAPNPQRRLKPGMFAVARVQTGAMAVPVVPRTAVRQDDDQARVFVAKGGRIEERLVQLGRRDGDAVAILAGVTAGERVVTRLAPELHDGLKVE